MSSHFLLQGISPNSTPSPSASHPPQTSSCVYSLDDGHSPATWESLLSLLLSSTSSPRSLCLSKANHVSPSHTRWMPAGNSGFCVPAQMGSHLIPRVVISPQWVDKVLRHRKLEELGLSRIASLFRVRLKDRPSSDAPFWVHHCYFSESNSSPSSPIVQMWFSKILPFLHYIVLI